MAAVWITNLFAVGSLSLQVLVVLIITGKIESISDRIVVIGAHTLSCVLLMEVLAFCLRRRTLDWIPADPGFRWAMVFTSYAVLILSAMALLTPGEVSWRLAIAAGIPSLMAGYSLFLVNPELSAKVPRSLIRTPVIVLGGVSAALATVSVPLSVETIVNQWRTAGEMKERMMQRTHERSELEKKALGALHKLPDDASLRELWPFLLSSSELARAEALDRISKSPALDRQLSTFLEAGREPWSYEAATYIADYFYGTPSAALCSGMNAHLKRLRVMMDKKANGSWQNEREYQRWTQKAFEAAKKLGNLGCDFQSERSLWLQKLQHSEGHLRDVLIGMMGQLDDENSTSWLASRLNE